MSGVTRFIKVRTSFRAVHNWPEASTYAGQDVQFLEASHRHTFHVLAELKVSHPDRQTEFFVFQNQVDQAIKHLYTVENDLVKNLGRRSCETIGEEIIAYLREYHKHEEQINIEVWEDNEVGARLESV